ncbi:MAG: AbgT family transporter, partial [Oscillospiraceae bacterium]|nr:AbgT family transporter [Oscillospiraceae bacterium]
PIALGVINSYKAKDDPEIGLGTLISMTLPYALAIGVAQIIILVIFMLLGLPIGPGTPLYV